eukprot:TRINITY_DN7866_c0_g1_i1.p1 TRINITY_DN7866_c0_g1~~TRINITY_DN7866_c0_g1_i1.p1  ORF type:complete len:189 (-),score=36.88 TRINITY_DN7866_c0_g1_i1:43-609(-)
MSYPLRQRSPSRPPPGLAQVPNYARGRRAVRELSDEQFQEVKDAFELFDQDGSGFIDVRELKLAMRALGVETVGQELRGFVKDIGADTSGTVSFDDFCGLMAGRMPALDSQEEISKVFQMFDEDGKGRITFHDLRRVCDELGRDLSNDEISDIIDAVDRDGDGQLNFSEFFRVLRRRGKNWLDCSDSD